MACWCGKMLGHDGPHKMRRPGFTLIELIVLVAIVLIAAGAGYSIFGWINGKTMITVHHYKNNDVYFVDSYTRNGPCIEFETWTGARRTVCSDYEISE
jgi:prepilin-type N-terminal cleavage/methylation domain-containing protein